jgi:hypothetical protein
MRNEPRPEGCGLQPPNRHGHLVTIHNPSPPSRGWTHAYRWQAAQRTIGLRGLLLLPPVHGGGTGLVEGGDLFAVRLDAKPMGPCVVTGVEQLGPDQVPDKGVGESALLETNIVDRPTSGPELAEQPCWKLTSCATRVGLASGEASCKQALIPIQTMATTGWIICQNRVGRVAAPRRGRERRPRAHSQRGHAGLPQHPVY